MTSSRKYQDVYENFTSRDFGIFAGASVLLASAIITLLGTSAPILTRIVGEAQAVDTSFYNITNYPLGVLIAILMGLFPLFRWGTDELKSAKTAILSSLALAVAGTVVVFATGARGTFYLIFMFASFFGLFANLYMFLKTIRHGVKFIGSYMTHLGVALVFAGIIATGGWAVTERAMVPIGGSADAVGVTIEASQVQVSADGTVTTVPLKLSKDGKLIAEGTPSMQLTNMGSTMRHPMIYSTLTQDIYISPLAIQDAAGGVSALQGDHLQIQKGAVVSSGGFDISFSSFDLSAMNSGKVGAAIKATEGSSVLYEGTLYYSVSGTGGSDSYTVFEGSGGKYKLALESIDASSGLVFMDFAKASEEALEGGSMLLVEASRKPFVWLLWIGAMMIVIGTAVAVVRRKSEAK
jgi:cytochrome c-type biogenesis protein CcmF